MKHRHAELMMEYARDAMETDKPWERWEYSLEGRVWMDLISQPRWGDDYEYRRKPRTININGHEVPEPVRSPLENGTIYYISYISAPDDALAWDCKWRSDKYDFNYLKKGIVHLTEEAAIKHAEALLSFTRIEK